MDPEEVRAGILLVGVGLFKKTSQVTEIDVVCDFKINYSNEVAST